MLLLACWLGGTAAEARVDIIPWPSVVVEGEGAFEFDSKTRISNSVELAGAADALRSVLRFAPEPGGEGAGLPTNVAFEFRPELAREAYRLEVERERIAIAASGDAGAFYAVQTLRQLLPVDSFGAEPASGVAWRVPVVRIEDAPRFEWRGMHLDVGRHFMPVHSVLRFIDQLALHKLNRFHWHLTEDQGWRIEILRYPNLTDVGAWREETETSVFGGKAFDGILYGGFYSQDDVRRVVAYAAARHVTVVPEIEMPGHARAAIAAYPELGNLDRALTVGTTWGPSSHIFNVAESTFTFLENVLLEVMQLFPSEYIHIGGDEALKQEWESSPSVQARMAALGLDDEEALQAWFIARMHRFLADHGRRLVGWDEILSGGNLPSGAIVMSWRGVEPGIRALEAGNSVVMAPMRPTYFDYKQSSGADEPQAFPMINTLADVYAYDPMPANLSEAAASRLLGAQGQLWTEHMRTPEHVEYMAFPRVAALAEVLWVAPQRKDLGHFLARLAPHLQRLERLGVRYRPLGNDRLNLWRRLQQRMIDWAIRSAM